MNLKGPSQNSSATKHSYGVNKGFWHAHIGWILFWRHKTNYNNVNDLRKSKLVAHQHYYHELWSIGGGIVLPMLIAWAIVALALAAVTLTGSVYSYNLYFAIACAGAMPLMWLVCRWVGVVYRSVPHLQKGPA